MPHLNIDPVMITRADPGCLAADRQPLCQTFLPLCAFRSGKSSPALPMSSRQGLPLEGTFHCPSTREWRDKLTRRMKHMAEQIAESMGGRCEFDPSRVPLPRQRQDLTDRSRRWAEENVGKENVEDLEIWMAAEDFAFYSQQAKALFYPLASGTKRKALLPPFTPQPSTSTKAP